MPFLSVPYTAIICYHTMYYSAPWYMYNWYTAPLLMKPNNIASAHTKQHVLQGVVHKRHTILTFLWNYTLSSAYHAVPPCSALWPFPAGRACFAGRGVDIYGLNPNIGPISQLLATVVVDFHLIPSCESLKVLLFTWAIFSRNPCWDRLQLLRHVLRDCGEHFLDTFLNFE